VYFLVLLIVVVLVVVVRWPSSARRGPVNGSTEAALRLRSGSQNGLRRRWRHGQLQVSPGTLTFQPGGPLGLRFPKRAPFSIAVTGVSDELNSTGWSQAWIVNPMFVTTEFTTSTGVIVVAASRPSLNQFRGVVLLEA
jgi:hypothetical protein